MTQVLAKKRGLLLAIAIMAMIVPGVAYARNGAAEEVRQSQVSQTETTTGDDSTEGTDEQTEVENETETESDTTKASGNERLEAVKEKASERIVAAKARLEGAKLKRCEAQQKAITNIMSRIGDRGQKQMELFSTIAERVETFYTEKGYSVDTYESLVTDVNTKKTAAQAAVTEIKDAETTFSCDGDNPHGVIDSFKESLKSEIAALKEYRTAVKNLIVGVKSGQPGDSPEATVEGGQE